MRSRDEVDDISSEGNLTGIQAVARFDEGLSLSVAARGEKKVKHFNNSS